MKKILAILSVMLIVVGVASGCKKKNDESKNTENNSQVVKYEDAKLNDGIVANANGKVDITTDEFRFYLAQNVESVYAQNGMSSATKEDKEAFWAREENGSPLKETFYDTVIDGYLGLVSLVCLAEDKGIAVTDEEVAAELSQEGMADAIAHYKDTYGVSEDSIKAYMKKQMIYEKYATEYIENDNRMQVSDEKISEYFKENFIKAQHILKMTVNQETGEALSEEEKNQTLEDTKALLEKVKKDDADFKAIMLEESQDPGSQQQPDGYIFTEGEMVTEFYEGAKALKDNEISDIVETSYGYHIIKRLPLEDADLDDTKKQSIASNFKTLAFQEILKESKDKMDAKVDYQQIYKVEGILY